MSASRDSARNAEIDRRFTEALDLPADVHPEFLADLRADDPELADAVAALLAADRWAAGADDRLDADQVRSRPALETGFGLRGPVWDELATDGANGPYRPGTRVGAYRIVDELGRGGMSVVYLAERADELFEHRVALKFLAVGGVEGELHRFEQERRILATLSHPNIARLLDGRVDERGRPYIVMELVDGQSITRYCAEEELALERRLDLFSRVTDAVGFAHRNLVVHRDIKPSNILVTRDGDVKLLDFGIARLLEPGSAGDLGAPPTRAAVRVLTPEYASPEQVLGERITTSSDVYQLGLLLYEMLTGRRPFDLHDSRAAEIERAVCEEEPSRPSAITSESGTVPIRRLRGDLDNIVLKALQKAPEHRYATVGELADDLERFRSGLPVRARRPTLAYRARRFVRRHAAALAVVAAVVVLLIGYAVTVTIQSRRVAAEAAKTEQVKEFLASLFVQANPGVAKGSEPTASELVEAGARRVAVSLADQPDVQAEMMVVLGGVYSTLGRYEDAIRQYEPALAIQRRLYGPLNENVVRAGNELAATLHYAGRYEEAEAMLREVLAGRRHLFGSRSGEVGETLNNLGDLLHSRGEFPEAEVVLREALAVQNEAAGAESYGAARASRDLANVLRDRGAYAEAEPLYRRSLAISYAVDGEVDPIVAQTQNDLARLLAETGRYEEAETLLHDALSIYAVLYANGHPMEGTTYRNLGLLRLREGRPAEAQAELARALANYDRTLDADNALVTRARRFRAEALLENGDPLAAAAVADDVVRRMREVGLTRHPALVDGLWTLGRALAATGRPQEGAERIAEALALREATSVPEDPSLARLRGDLERARIAASSM